jgi:carboxymethylenebutenolidase
LNDTVKAFCKRLAQAGFTAFAPDLYHGKVTDTIPGAEALVKALNAKEMQAKAEITQAVHFLKERTGKAEKGLAVIGFSLGASYALDLSVTAPEHIRSCVVFYGTGPGDFTGSKADYLGHFAENDPFEPRAGVDATEAAIQAAGRPVTFHDYPGTGHWFFEPDRTEAYSEPAAAQAWDRTVQFLWRPTSF